jgi:hypothetical protein
VESVEQQRVLLACSSFAHVRGSEAPPRIALAFGEREETNFQPERVVHAA